VERSKSVIGDQQRGGRGFLQEILHTVIVTFERGPMKRSCTIVSHSIYLGTMGAKMNHYVEVPSHASQMEGSMTILWNRSMSPCHSISLSYLCHSIDRDPQLIEEIFHCFSMTKVCDDVQPINEDMIIPQITGSLPFPQDLLQTLHVATNTADGKEFLIRRLPDMFEFMNK
jgi:hypothetical protein